MLDVGVVAALRGPPTPFDDDSSVLDDGRSGSHSIVPFVP